MAQTQKNTDEEFLPVFGSNQPESRRFLSVWGSRGAVPQMGIVGGRMVSSLARHRDGDDFLGGWARQNTRAWAEQRRRTLSPAQRFFEKRTELR